MEERQGHLNFPDGIYGCSVGSILATAIAFGLSAANIQRMFEEDFTLSAALPPVRLHNLKEFAHRKGLYPMHHLEAVVTKSFDNCGIDLRGKVLADAPQPLFLLASNLTTNRATWFTGQIPILAAIRASCCLPFVFEPQIIENNVYVDGGIAEAYIHKCLPKPCLTFHMDRSGMSLFPTQLQDMSLRTLMGHVLYAMRAKSDVPSYVVVLHNDDVQVLQELTPDIRKALMDSGYSITARALPVAELALQKLQ